MSRRARKLKPHLLLGSDDGTISIWLVPHDSQPIWQTYWYRWACPHCGEEVEEGGIELDVRTVPGFTDYPPLRGAFNNESLTAYFYAERRHHAEIIARAIDADWQPRTPA